MTRLYLILLLFFAFTVQTTVQTQAQNDPSRNRTKKDRYRQNGYDQKVAKNAVYLELGGNGLIYTINYDRMIGNKFNVRAGIETYGAFSQNGEGSGVIVLPVMVNYLAGQGNNRLELGLGKLFSQINLDFGDDSRFSRFSDNTYTATIGFRHQPRNGGLLFRVGLTPIIGRELTFMWAGASIGASF